MWGGQKIVLQPAARGAEYMHWIIPELECPKYKANATGKKLGVRARAYS